MPNPVLSLARTGDLLLVGCGDGVYRSHDRGRTWRHVLAAPAVLAVGLSADGRVLAGTDGDGIYRSENGGVDWQSANAGLLDLDILAICLAPDFAETGLAWAGTGSGLYQTINSGRSWRSVDLVGVDEVAVTAIAASRDFSADQALLVGTEEHGLYRTLDGGKSWAPVGEVPDEITAVAAAWQGKLCFAVAAGEFVYMATVEETFRLCCELPSPILSMAFSGEDLLVGLAREGMLILRDKKQVSVNVGLHGVPLGRLWASERGLVAASSDGSIGIFDGEKWVLPRGLEGHVTDVAPGRGGALWAIADRQLFRLELAGHGWSESTSTAGNAACLASAGRSGSVLVGFSDGRIADVQNGGSIDRCPGGPMLGLIALEGADERVLLALAPNSTGATVWRFRQRTAEWDELLQFDGAGQPLLAAAGDAKKAIVIVGADTRIAIADPLSDDPDIRLVDIGPAVVRRLAVEMDGGSVIFAATDRGLFQSRDGVSFAQDADFARIAIGYRDCGQADLCDRCTW